MSLKYRIGGIGWFNFETLSQTLLKAVIGPGVTSFGGSKDGGRDATFIGAAAYPSAASPWSGRWVFQVKYVDLDIVSARDAAKALIGAFGTEVRHILTRRQAQWDSPPDNYVLITNVPLTAENREALNRVAIQAGVATRFAAVDGREICEWLDLHAQVRRAYPQLLALADLDVIVNAEVLGRSRAYLDQWQPHLVSFVATDAYRRALEILQQRHFVVLDGAPEVGKSTIAAAIALQYAAAGFEVVDVRRAGDVHAVFRSETAQVFVADDAVGSIALDPSATDQWSRDLPGVLRRLDKRHLLVWTGRSYILAEAVAQSRLADAVARFPGVHHVLVTVEALSEQEKAAMLYNHAKHARLSDSVRALLRRLAPKIVESADLTPERVRQLTADVLRQKAVQSETVLQFLANPGRRWVQAYRNLSASEQALLSGLLTLRGPAKVEDVREVYASRAAVLPSRALAFEDTLARMSPGFLRARTSFGGETAVDFQHPSLRDVLISELREDPTARRRFFALAGPTAIAAIARGIGALVRGSADAEHAVTPGNDEELNELIGRVLTLAAGPLPSEAWRELMAAAQQLLPVAESAVVGEAPNARLHRAWDTIAGLAFGVLHTPLAPPDVDLRGLARTHGGQLLGAIVRAFAASATYQANTRYPLHAWAPLLRRFSQLTVYLEPPARVAYADALVVDCLGAIEEDPWAVASVLEWARETEPLSYRQRVGAGAVSSLVAAVRSKLANLVERGEDLAAQSDPEEGDYPDQDDYERWEQDAETQTAATSRIVAWAKAHDPELCEPPELDRLSALRERITPPPEPDYDDIQPARTSTSISFWSVQRLFEDL